MNPQTNSAKIPLLLTQRVGDKPKDLAQLEQVEFTNPIGQNSSTDNVVSVYTENSIIKNNRYNEHDFEYQE